MSKGLTNTIRFVRKSMKLEGLDLERAKLYSRGYAMLTELEGEPVYVFIFTNATTFSDNLTRNTDGVKIEYGNVVVDYTRNGNEEEKEEKPIKKKTKK